VVKKWATSLAQTRQAPSSNVPCVATHELLTTQRNAVLEAIVNEGLNPSDFEWRTQKSQVTPSPTYGIPYSIEVLVHVPTGSAFAFDLDAAYGHHYAVAHPGREGPTERNDAGDWPYELNYVYEWLTRVNREYHTPDLWAEIYDRNELLALESDEAKNTRYRYSGPPTWRRDDLTRVAAAAAASGAGHRSSSHPSETSISLGA